MLGVVYFVRDVQGRIKIGYTANLSQRISAISSMVGPVDVLATVRGGAILEAHFHETFADERLASEWFAGSDALYKLIDTITCGSYQPPVGYSEVDEVKGSFNAEAAFDAAKQEAKRHLIKIAEPGLLGEGVAEVIRRVARITGFSASRVRDLWYSEIRTIHSYEMDRLRTLAHVPVDLDGAFYSALSERIAACEAAIVRQQDNASVLGGPDA